MAIPDLIGPHILLRRPRDSDADALLRLPIDPDIVRMYGREHTGSSHRTPDSVARTLAWMRAEPLLWVIDAGGYVGHVRLHSLNDSDRRAALAIGIDDSTQLNRGLGTDAMCLVLGYAFGPLGLHRVSVRVLDYNARALRAYEKVGFKREGVERQSARVADAWHDDVMLGVLAHEFGAAQGGIDA